MIENIFSPKLTRILPPSVLADEKLKASAEALDLELEKLSGASLEVLHLPRLDELSSDVLDYLAWQWHVDNYDTSFDETTKRAMIRESIYLHRIKGTPYAVELAIAPFTEGSSVVEWFDYGGQPYFFKISLNSIVDLGDDGEKFIRIIFAAKNVRSWLEEIFIDLTREVLDHHKLYHGVVEAAGGNIKVDIINRRCHREENHHKLYHGITEAAGGNIKVGINSGIEKSSSGFYHGIIEAVGGTIYFNVDFSFNPEEVTPLAGNLIYLIFSFPSGSRRVISMPNPRLDVTGSEVVAISNFSKLEKILLNRDGEFTDGISRAFIMTSYVESLI